MRKLLFSLMLLLAMPTIAQKRHYLTPVSPVEVMSKNCYFSFMLDRNPQMRALINEDKQLSQIATGQRQLLAETPYGELRAKDLMLSDETIEMVGNKLQNLYDHDKSFHSFVDDSICATGCYIMISGKGNDVVKRIWSHDAKAINHAIDVYGNGAKPNYPLIDSVSFDVRSSRFLQHVLPLVANSSLMAIGQDPIFATAPMQFAKLLLAANNRLQAADFEPMASGVNRAAYQAVAKTQWKQYPYSAIVVLGVGPETPTEPVTAESLMRAEYAAQCWKAGMVPYIIVSGGKAHPHGTPYCEAQEMKRYLVDVCRVPESVVIMEPHARHTTTNLRNAGRIMIRQGFPLDKPALVTGSKSHIDYVVGEGFSKRFNKELGFLPVNITKRKNVLLAEFTVNESCLQLDDDEPMDP